jgi:arylamine N-acetyltransferase
MLPIEEILEALDLSRAEPGIGFLQALFSRFNARVPFETVSKILRHAEVADPHEKARRPDVFWREHVDLGTGGTCFARVAAFDALLCGLGFETRKVLGRVERDFDHAALLVEGGTGTAICDVGFPLPAIVPARSARVETALVELVACPTERGFRIDLEDGVPEGPRQLEIFDAPVSETEFEARWQATFHPESRFLTRTLLRRQEESRVVSYSRGEIHVDDRHSRLTVAIAPPRAARLSGIFQIDAGVLQSAGDLVGEPPSSSRPGGLVSYLETSVAQERAFAAIASPDAYRRLLEGVARVIHEEATKGLWRFTLGPPQAEEPAKGEHLLEEVSPDPGRLALRVRRQTSRSAFDSELRVEVRSGKTYLVREAFFEAAREDLLRNDSLRGRLAGALAVDLLAWARLIR